MLKATHTIGPALAMVFLVVSLPGRVAAQEADPDRNISVRYDQVPLETVLQDLTRLTGMKFSYSSELVPADRKITYHAENKPFKNILSDILNQAGIRFEPVRGYMVLTPLPGGGTQAKPGMFTIRGTVTDSATSETMIGAAVYVPETGKGVITNNYGFYSLTLPAGTYTLQVSYLGYPVVSRQVVLTGDMVWNIRLKPVPILMKEIVINPATAADRVLAAFAAQVRVDPAQVRKQSAALGETDMLKSLDNLPGISFQSDGSSFFSVRGGAYDQNLVLLDEAPIYNPSHLLGLFTPIIPEAIKSTEIYRADFPIQYGGRLSSVIDIRARDGNMERFSGSVNLSPVSTRLSVEGPFRKEASSYFLSFRISTFGLLVKALNPNVESFYFADFTSKFNLKLGQKDRLFLTIFSGKDNFINKSGDKRTGLIWGNSSATLRWAHVYGDRLFSNTTLSGSKYEYSLYTDYDRKTYWNSDITGASLKSEYTWYIRPHNMLKFGIHIGGNFFNPGNYLSPNTTLDTMRVSRVNSTEWVAYAGHEFRPFPAMQVNYGIRVTNWSDFGEAFSILYDPYHNPVSQEKYGKGVRYYSRTMPEPRVSLSLKAGRHASVKASYNRTIQNINQISNSISPFNSLEVWLPSGPNIKPQHADIFDAGLLFNWPARSVEMSLDAYYKRMYNQVTYQDHAEMFLNPYLEGELRQGDGTVRGFEVLLRKTQGRLTGQIGYGYARSRLHNGGKPYPTHQDKPVDLACTADFRIRPRWSASLNLQYTSGMPLSTPTGFLYYRGARVPVYGALNNDRLPDYRRVDLGSTWRLNRTDRHFEHYLTFTVYNIFSTRNYAFLNFNKIQDPDGGFQVPADHLNPPEQVVTYRYVYSLVPSFNYSLKF